MSEGVRVIKATLTGTIIKLSFTAAIFALPLPVATAADWNHWRGPTQDGRAPGDGIFGDTFGLKTIWKVRLGSAYSGIVVSGGRVVTMFSDGRVDHLVALDAADGSELWRYRIDTTYKGHDGSDDGPLSTPVIDHGVVYGLGPRGKLFAVDLGDGSEIWSIDMAGRFQSDEPDYGFATTPLVEGDVLVVQIGGADGKSIVGLDKATGATIWTQLAYFVSYQSPSVMTLAGRRQILVIDRDNMAGIDPASGELLWTFDHRGNGFSNNPHAVPLGDNRFLLKFTASIAVFEIRRSGDDYEIRKIYKAEVFKKSYLPPLYNDGYLYGFTSGFLTCVDAATGKKVWQSRPPGGKGMVLVDGHLAILGANGIVVVAEATPEGYREKARVQALERSDFAWPSFANGTIFARDLADIAAVSITESVATAIAAESSAALAGTEFHAFLKRVRASSTPQAVVDEYMTRQERFPIIDNGRFAHFVYRGNVEDVVILGTMLDKGAAESFARVEGTDLYYLSLELDPDARYEYRFQVNFTGYLLDRSNPNTEPDILKGKWSVVTMPRHAASEPFGDVEQARRGEMVTLPHSSKVLRNRRLLRIYLPAGYEGGNDRYPVLYVSSGREWIANGRMIAALDNLIGKRVAPLIVVFVDKSGRNSWYELGQNKSLQYAQMLAEEIVPKIDTRYRTIRKPEARVLMGATDSARVSLHTALTYPEVFGGVAVRTMSLAGTGSEVLALLTKPTLPGLRLFVDWNRFERRSRENRYDRRKDSLRLVGALDRRGYAHVGGERADSHGWGSLRAGTPAMLEFFFPLP